MSSRALLSAVLLFAIDATARADVPPDDGWKYVGNNFRATGLAAFPDHVLVAYPWSASNGAPTREHVVMKEGEAVSIGRRSPDIVLWAVRRTAWETFAKTLTRDEDTDAARLDAFLRAPDAVACDARPEPIGTLRDDDPRDVVEHTIVVRALADDACKLELARPPAALDRGGCRACSGGEGATSAWILALVALVVRRRAGVRAST